MEHAIDVKGLKAAINAVLDHLIEDLGHEKIMIDESSDYCWHCPVTEVHDVSKSPAGLDVGRLSDDADFVKLIKRGQSGDVSYNLVHVASLHRRENRKMK